MFFFEQLKRNALKFYYMIFKRKTLKYHIEPDFTILIYLSAFYVAFFVGYGFYNFIQVVYFIKLHLYTTDTYNITISDRQSQSDIETCKIKNA